MQIKPLQPTCISIVVFIINATYRKAKFSTVIFYINVNFIKLAVTHSNLYSVLHMDIRDAEKIVGKKVKIISSESRSFVLISDCHHSRGSICVQVVYGYNIESLEILNHVLTSHDCIDKKLLERFSQRIATSPRIP
ncbi:conserved hypothetical protein [Trichinella spiralis]|uniref:hypothetical protein n=1 Tax=Trichinella spiralis TaxID=6334 RepID=UPI0001EFC650|nr:conserved hypothetical protein [Trichinella spiralis]